MSRSHKDRRGGHFSSGISMHTRTDSGEVRPDYRDWHDTPKTRRWAKRQSHRAMRRDEVDHVNYQLEDNE